MNKLSRNKKKKKKQPCRYFLELINNVILM